jgi:uncharacterized protein YebE (UPF0316 family)
MEAINTLPIWALALFVFGLRIVDVSLGTLRTLSVVQGHLMVSVLIGFFEILLWGIAVANVILRVQESPILLLAFAGGFAAGNAAGIALERSLGIGRVVLRMVVSRKPEEIAELMRSKGHVMTTFKGEGRDGPRTLMFTTCTRRTLSQLVKEVAALDPQMFYTVDRFSNPGHGVPLPHPTGWRAIFKKK